MFPVDLPHPYFPWLTLIWNAVSSFSCAEYVHRSVPPVQHGYSRWSPKMHVMKTRPSSFVAFSPSVNHPVIHVAILNYQSFIHFTSFHISVHDNGPFPFLRWNLVTKRSKQFGFEVLKMMTTKRTFWDLTPLNPAEVCRRSEGIFCLYLQNLQQRSTSWLRTWLPIRPWRRRQYVPSKFRWNTEFYGITFHTTVLFTLKICHRGLNVTSQKTWEPKR
jgi:hypothetical protein